MRAISRSPQGLAVYGVSLALRVRPARPLGLRGHKARKANRVNPARKGYRESPVLPRKDKVVQLPCSVAAWEHKAPEAVTGRREPQALRVTPAAPAPRATRERLVADLKVNLALKAIKARQYKAPKEIKETLSKAHKVRMDPRETRARTAPCPAHRETRAVKGHRGTRDPKERRGMKGARVPKETRGRKGTRAARAARELKGARERRALRGHLARLN
jgi:hypothetical protein